jgi:hypothetical protein
MVAAIRGRWPLMLRTRLAVGVPHDFQVAVAQLNGQGGVETTTVSVRCWCSWPRAIF